jgi:hypothetical protein
MRIIFCCWLLGLSVYLRANEIDGLQTREQVKTFLIRKVDRKFKEYHLFERFARRTVPALTADFYKVDLDGDGRTDLIINDQNLIIVMATATGYRSSCLYHHERDRYLVAIDSSLGGKPESNPENKPGSNLGGKPGLKRLVISQTKLLPDPAGGIQYRDTTERVMLVYHGGGWMEYNASPTRDFTFKEITVRTSQCFGTCPVFEMTVRSNRTAYYKAILFNKEREGDFSGVIPPGELEEMAETLRYIPLEKLDSSYRVEWTDDQTITLEINYKDRIQRIEDYGKIGTFGLAHLYAFFFHWMDTVQWVQDFL